MPSIEDLRKQHEEIRKELEKRHRMALGLQKRIEAKRKEVSRLEEQLARVLGRAGAVATRKLSRKKKGPNQKEMIRALLAEAGKPMSMSDILDAMDARGYKWVSNEPRNALGVLLYTNQKVFKKVRPGFFELAKGA